MTGAINLTIFADASYCVKTKSAGWGAWLKRTGHLSRTAGSPVRQKVLRSTGAEIIAIVNSIFAARAAGLLFNEDVVMVQSDCVQALGMVLAHSPGSSTRQHKDGSVVTPCRWKSMTKEDRAAIIVLNSIVSEMSLQLIVRHVAGHKSGDGRQWVNRTCDKIAKAHMRKARSKMGEHDAA